MNIVFTPAAVLELLSNIDELKDYDLSITETLDGDLQLRVGDSTYTIDTDYLEEIAVPEDVVDTVEDINEDAYEDLVASEQFEDAASEPVEAGLIKEAIKSMLLGGAIKLIKKLI